MVLTSAEEESYAAAVRKLTGANPSVEDQLARLRLAFAIDPGDKAVTRFDEQLAVAGARIERRDVQLRRTLAACVLTARFGRPPGRRGLPTLAPDTAAALAARVLTHAEQRPVHPDVGSWADYWVRSLAMHVRLPRRQPTPPSFTPHLSVANADATAAEAAERTAEALHSAFAAFTQDLVRWSMELDPAEIRAQGEQIDLLWWLAGGAVPEPVPELVIWTATGLRRHTRRIPGPPGADQLLRRRLGKFAHAEVHLEELAETAARLVPDTVGDLCPLLTRQSAALVGRSLPAADAAQWLYDELSLVDLIEMA